jgi:hypothetical protein
LIGYPFTKNLLHIKSISNVLLNIHIFVCHLGLDGPVTFRTFEQFELPNSIGLSPIYVQD